MSDRRTPSNKSSFRGKTGTPAALGSTGKVNTSRKQPQNLTLRPLPKGTALNLNSQHEEGQMEFDLLYNRYLQAAMKQQIVKKLVATHEQSLKDQLAIQKDTLNNLTKTANQIKENTENIELLAKVNQNLNILKEVLEKFVGVCKEMDVEQNLEQLQQILESTKNTIGLVNIQAINNQEERDNLVEKLVSVNETTDKFMESGRDFAGVQLLASLKQDLENATARIRNNMESLEQLQMSAGRKMLKDLSDEFAKARKEKLEKKD